MINTSLFNKDNLEKTGEITGGIVDNFRNASAFGRLLQISVVGVVAVAAKAAASVSN